MSHHVHRPKARRRMGLAPRALHPQLPHHTVVAGGADSSHWGEPQGDAFVFLPGLVEVEAGDEQGDIPVAGLLEARVGGGLVLAEAGEEGLPGEQRLASDPRTSLLACHPCDCHKDPGHQSIFPS